MILKAHLREDDGSFLGLYGGKEKEGLLGHHQWRDANLKCKNPIYIPFTFPGDVNVVLAPMGDVVNLALASF